MNLESSSGNGLRVKGNEGQGEEMVRFRFQRLESWQFAIAFCDEICRITKSFPSDERFGLISQLRRAAVSIPANVAEGTGKSSPKEGIRFVEISYGSLMELISHIEVSFRQKWIQTEDYETIREKADKLARILSGYRNHLEKLKKSP